MPHQNREQKRGSYFVRWFPSQQLDLGPRGPVAQIEGLRPEARSRRPHCFLKGMNELTPEAVRSAFSHAIFPGPDPLLRNMRRAEQPVEDDQMRREIPVVGGRIH